MVSASLGSTASTRPAVVHALLRFCRESGLSRESRRRIVTESGSSLRASSIRSIAAAKRRFSSSARPALKVATASTFLRSSTVLGWRGTNGSGGSSPGSAVELGPLRPGLGNGLLLDLVFVFVLIGCRSAPGAGPGPSSSCDQDRAQPHEDWTDRPEHGHASSTTDRTDRARGRMDGSKPGHETAGFRRIHGIRVPDAMPRETGRAGAGEVVSGKSSRKTNTAMDLHGGISSTDMPRVGPRAAEKPSGRMVLGTLIDSQRPGEVNVSIRRRLRKRVEPDYRPPTTAVYSRGSEPLVA